MSLLSKSTFYPLHSNPHHLPPQTSKVTRSVIDQQPNLNSDDDEGEEGGAGLSTAFERDVEGEKLLMSLLAKQLQQQQPVQDMDVDMEDSSSNSNKKRKVEEESSGKDEEEVFEFRLLSSSKPNKKIALYPPASALYVPNPRDTPFSDDQLSLLRSQIQASAVDATWVVSQSLLRHDAPPSHPSQPYLLSSSQAPSTTPTPSSSTSTQPLPTFLVTSLPRQPSTNPFSKHLSPEPQEERGPGGHLPCAQFDVERVALPSSSSSSTTKTTAPAEPTYQRPEWFSLPPPRPSQSTSSSSTSPQKKKKKKSRPPTNKSKNNTAQPTPPPMFYLPPTPTPSAPVGLGGKSRGYGWGYGAGREELWGGEERGWVRDRMVVGWVGGGRGEGWWGKGGRVWGETQR